MKNDNLTQLGLAALLPGIDMAIQQLQEQRQQIVAALPSPANKSEPHIVSDPATPEAMAYAEDYWSRRARLGANAVKNAATLFLAKKDNGTKRHLTDAQKEHLSKVAKERWAKMSPRKRKAEQKKLHAGRLAKKAIA